MRGASESRAAFAIHPPWICGYVHSPNRRGLVATRLDPLQEVQEIGLKVRASL